MELELGIVREPVGSNPKQRLRVFSEVGGTIGRAPDNYWVLPDPKSYLSTHHCEILFKEGAFWIRDTSRNGVFLNDSSKPIGYGHQARLSDGDEIALATYMVRARLRAKRSRPVPSAVHLPEPRPAKGQPLPSGSAVSTNSDREHVAARIMAVNTIDPDPATDVHDSSAVPDHDLSTAAADHGPRNGTASDPARPLEDTAEHANLATEAVPADGKAPAPEPESQLAPLTTTQTLDPSQVESEAARVIHIDKVRLQSIGRLPPKAAERLISNQIRHIKRPIIKNALGKGIEPVPHGHLVMVTSSLPGEGKTFNSINLAFSIAREKDLEVVLIDADVAKRDVSRVFGVTDEPGLLNALSDDLLDVESLILQTDVKGFSILPAGHCNEEDVATELLASTRMDEIATQLGARSKHRIALFDSPPLLLTNESRVLASLMGQIVMVVRASVTPRAAVLEAVTYLDEQTPLGLVLNQSTSSAMGSYYGYGSYGYGTYGASEENGDTSQKGK